ncbi:MAG: hypothetical protein Greene041619_1018 [Candidatus Peregrinibacteria bacterium Greene0416_19]|nr:MAG: hypothetical protein Greene041619_1018 [Candidatus Peregrinibacteria bacterium Greene0416_19]
MRSFLPPAFVLFGAASACFFATGAAVLAGLGGTPGGLPADCAIVFGARVHAMTDERGNRLFAPGPGIARRVDTALSLYREKEIRKLFMTGGKSEPERASEASVMRQRAIDSGVAPADIIVEGDSRSTLENLRNVRPLAGDCRRVVAVSDDYHLARIRYLAHRIGWKDLRTHPASPRAATGFWIRSLLREALAILWYTVN